MPDVLVFAALLPKLRGTPIVLNFHDTFPELFATLFDRPPDHPLVRLIRAEERVSASFADGHVFVTSEARDLLRARGVAAERTQVVMNTPDEQRLRRAPRAPRAAGRRRSCGSSTTAASPTVSGSRPWSGPSPYCVSAARRSRLTSTAPTPRQRAPSPSPRRRSPRTGVRIAPQPTPVDEIPGRLSAAHLGVVPTLRDEFTEFLLPVKLLEYVHMGLPAVASRLPVIERYFGDDVLLAEPGDPASIAAAIEGVRAEPQVALARAERASQRLAEIEWRRQRSGYLALIDELVAGAASA